MRMQMLRYQMGVVVVMAIALLGGGTADRPLPAAAQEKQVVVELGASHERVNPGECALVEWALHPAGDWPVKFGNEQVPAAGHREVCPQTTTTYTLNVEAPDGIVSRQVTVTVGDEPAADTPTPEVEPAPGGKEPPIYFQVVEPEAIPRGTCAKLSWEVDVGTDSTLTINGQEIPPASAVKICPQETAKYELLVKHPGGVSKREIILTVMETLGGGVPEEGVVPPEEVAAPAGEPGGATVLFAALPDSVAQGACALLHWSVTPSEGWPVFLDGQEVASPWEQEVCPQTTTTYELLVEAPGGPVLRSVTLQVLAAPGAAPPAPGPGQVAVPPAQDRVDLAVTDLFADKDIQGTVHLRITNRGPATLSNAQVEVKCGNQGNPLGNQPPWSHSEAPWTVNLNLKPGETSAVATKMVVDTSQYNYDAWCSVRPLEHTETNDGNNRYDETITRVGATQPPGTTPGADVRPSDLKIESGALITRITNDGPDTLTNKKVEVTVSGCGPGKEHTVNLAPGQTYTVDTYCQPAAGKKSYTVSVKAMDFTDPNGGNNSYTETLDGGGGSPAVPPGGSSWGILTADLAVTDIFATSLPKGDLYLRITNNGPDRAQVDWLQINCMFQIYRYNGTKPPLALGALMSVPVDLNPGQTKEYQIYHPDFDTTNQWYEYSCAVAPKFNDPNPGNDRYSETIPPPP
jgi:hypothetical protein